MPYPNSVDPGRPLDYINLKQYCAIDGVSDDSSGFTTAYALASANNMALFHPGGTLIKGNDTLLSNVHIFGAGNNVSFIKLKTGANTDLFSAYTGSINLSGAGGTGSTTGVTGWGLHNLCLDGNLAGQSSGTSYCLRFYGRNYVIEHVDIRNGYSGNVYADWNGGGDPVESATVARWTDVTVHDSGGHEFTFGGPTDSYLINMQAFHNMYGHGFHIGPNAGGLQAFHCHPYTGTVGGTSGSAYLNWLIECGQAQFVDCEAEGSSVGMVVILGGDITWQGGRIFGNSGLYSVFGMQLGQQAGNTPYLNSVYQSAGVTTAVSASNCNINTKIERCEGTNGALWLANDGGNNRYDMVINLTAGSYITGTPASNSTMFMRSAGLTSDGTNAKGGFNKVAQDSLAAFVISDGTNDIVNVNTHSKYLQVAQGGQFRMYSDALSTLTFLILNGTVFYGMSGSSPDPGNSGTISTGVGQATVTPTANETGLILQNGIFTGQKVSVINESSSFSLTFATSGTSHVATGASCVIAANTGQCFEWDSNKSLWYTV